VINNLFKTLLYIVKKVLLLLFYSHAEEKGLGLKRYIITITVILLIFLVSFLVLQVFEIPFLSNPAFIKTGGIVAAVSGVLLLSFDVLLPVPSSVVMIGMGTLFGIVNGSVLSLIGCLNSALFGFYLG